jgi:hypothetical protein
MTQEDNDKAFSDWINSFSDYMEPDDGKLYVIRSPSDIIKVHEDLEKLLE